MVRVGKLVPPLVACGGVLALGACAAAPPVGPTVLAIPGKGQSLAQFQQEDASCRQYAAERTGGVQPGQAATNAAVGSAVVGTALGAAAGAAIGAASGAAGAGAAIGAGAGLLGGSLIGAGNGAASAAGLQQAYNINYSQCMIAQGNTVRAPPGPYPAYGYPAYGYGYPAYGYGYPAYGYPAYYGYPYGGPVVVAPSVTLGWGWGWHGGWGWYRGWGWHGGGWGGWHH